MRWAGHVARICVEREVFRVLVGKPKGERPLGAPRRRWKDNIRMHLKEIGCRCMNWIGPAHYGDMWRTLVSAVMYFGFRKLREFFITRRKVSFSRRNLHHAVSK